MSSSRTDILSVIRIRIYLNYVGLPHVIDPAIHPAIVHMYLADVILVSAPVPIGLLDFCLVLGLGPNRSKNKLTEW